MNYLAQSALDNAERCLELAEEEIIVVISKGNDALPAKQAEIEGLHQIVKKLVKKGKIGHGGIIVGDHRFDVRYVTDGAMAYMELAKQWRYIADLYARN